MTCMDGSTTDEVLRGLGMKSRLLNVLDGRKLVFVGHVLQMGGLGGNMLISAVNGRRGSGRPKIRTQEI